MPEETCCDVASKLLRLISGSTNDQVKTQAYLTLEVLYASRRTNQFGDHITILLKSLLEAPELPDAFDSKEKLGHGDQRVVSYIQATS